MCDIKQIICIVEDVLKAWINVRFSENLVCPIIEFQMACHSTLCPLTKQVIWNLYIIIR